MRRAETRGYRPGPNVYSVGVSLVRGLKLPNPAELFANGPHAATETFEIGDPDLDTEKSLGLDVSLRRQVRAPLRVWRNS